MSRGTSSPRHAERRRRSQRPERATHHADLRGLEAAARSYRTARSLPLNQLRPGTVIDAWIEYADGCGWKRRPAIVLEVHRRAIYVAPCSTSDANRSRRTNLRLDGLSEAGLDEKSVVLISRCVDIPRTDALRILGECLPPDFKAVASAAPPRQSRDQRCVSDGQ
jgi:PemK-like, MazF-like toxin of type II toxin-antitoxin system